MVSNKNLKFYPLIHDRWQDFEKLFGKNGACAGCWCMFNRLTRKEFEAGQYDKNKRAMKKIVGNGREPGILAYLNGEVVGWCSVEPREKFEALKKSRVFKPVDDTPTWIISCVFVDKNYRNMGVSEGLIKAAVKHVKKNGGVAVEGCPVEPRKDRMPDVFAYYGLPSSFKKAGFKEIARRTEIRPLMRYTIKKSK
jgi:GNAT superfamily N-acetyltransferase